MVVKLGTLSHRDLNVIPGTWEALDAELDSPWGLVNDDEVLALADNSRAPVNLSHAVRVDHTCGRQAKLANSSSCSSCLR